MSERKPPARRPARHGGPMGGPFGGGGVPGEKARDFKGTMKKLMAYLRPYRVGIIVVLIFACVSAIFAIVGPKLLGQATTRLFEGAINKLSGVPGATIDFDYIGKRLLFIMDLYVISAAFSYIQGYLMAGISQRVAFNLRRSISEKINRMPLKFFDNMTHGEVLSRVTNDVDMISNSLGQSLSQIISGFTTVVGVMVMMFSISWLMTLAALLIIPLSAILVSLVVKRSQKFFMSQQEYLGHVNGHVEEMYGGHKVMKAYNGEQRSIEQFGELNHQLYNSAWKSQFLSGLMMPVIMFVGNLGYVMVCMLGGWLAIKRTIEVGDILSFIQYVRMFNQPLSQIAQIANILQSTAAASERVFEFLGEEEERKDGAETVELSDVRGEVSFDHVRFGYSEDKIIIKDFSASIKSGEKVAIVGPTGAGKTTIVKLLLRFYELNGGSISIDGVDITRYSRDELRSMLGMVLQDTWLYNASIRENIRYGRLDATDEEVYTAAAAAHVDHFIHTLPGGYDMELNEEASNISQGQKQLLTIARAVLADPKILILDEATSSVDTRTEILIQRAMDNLMKGRTSFVIAHRLSTIRDADLILVMNEGDIVEQGTHQELLDKGGFYSSLYMSQFEQAEESA